MPRFFFDTDNGEVIHVDREGHDLPHRAAAKAAAIAALPEMADDDLPDGDRRIFSVSVRDIDQVIYRATLTFRGDWIR